MYIVLNATSPLAMEGNIPSDLPVNGEYTIDFMQFEIKFFTFSYILVIKYDFCK